MRKHYWEVIYVYRISKDPDVRKNEILDTAEKLFMEKGYEKTTVGNIVNRIGVAKGTFYYYFESKESIIDSIIERRFKRAREDADNIINNTELNAIEKMEKLMWLLLNPSEEREKFFCSIDFENNARIHQKRDVTFYRVFKKIVLNIVEEGISDGFFNCKYYQDITEIVFIGIDKFMYINVKELKDKKVFFKKITAIQELLEKVLGIEEGSLDIMGSKK